MRQVCKHACGEAGPELRCPAVQLGVLAGIGAAAQRYCRRGLLVKQQPFQRLCHAGRTTAIAGGAVLGSVHLFHLYYLVAVLIFAFYGAIIGGEPWIRAIICYLLPWLPGLTATTGVLFAAVWLKRLFSPRERQVISVLGHAVSSTQMPRLWQAVRDWAEQASLCPPAHIVIVMEITSYYTPQPVQSEDGIHEGGTLCCSLPLARQFSESEYAALVVSQLSTGQMVSPWWQDYLLEWNRYVLNPKLTLPSQRAWPLSRATEEGKRVELGPALPAVRVWREIWKPLERELYDQVLWKKLQPARVLAGSERGLKTFIMNYVFKQRWTEFLDKVRTDLRRVRIALSDGCEVAARDYYANLSILFAETTDEKHQPSAPAIALFDEAEQWEEQLSRTLCGRMVWG